MNPFPNQCPICESKQLTVNKFECRNCGTTFSGEFEPQRGQNPFGHLSPEHLEFVRVFIKCEGKLNRMEGELGLSYPTIRNRLGDVVRAMGFEPSKDEPAAPRPLTDEQRRKILDDLDAGALDADKAMKMLRGEQVDV
jgi:hypothetical protein